MTIMGGKHRVKCKGMWRLLGTNDVQSEVLGNVTILCIVKCRGM
jgi:hypothetical protein